MDAMIGTDWHDKNVQLWSARQGFVTVRMWAGPIVSQQGDGDSHGRLASGASAGDWQVGDILLAGHHHPVIGRSNQLGLDTRSSIT